jgi:hypothetical protein
MNSNEPMDLTSTIDDNQLNDSYSSISSIDDEFNDKINEFNDDEIDVEKLSDQEEDANENEEDKKPSLEQEESSPKTLESTVQSAPFMLNGKKYYRKLFKH